MNIQEETLDLISIISKDAFNELNSKEIEDLFNQIILKLIEIKEPIIIKKNLLEPVTKQSIGAMTRQARITTDRDLYFDQNDFEKTFGLFNDMKIQPYEGIFNHTVNDTWHQDYKLNLFEDHYNPEKIEKNKIKNPNPNYEHLLNNGYKNRYKIKGWK